MYGAHRAELLCQRQIASRKQTSLCPLNKYALVRSMPKKNVLYTGLLLLLLLLFIVYLPLVSLMFHLNVSNALQGLVETFEMDASVGFAVH